MRKIFLNSLLIFLVSFSLFSCNTTKKVKYFQDIPDSGRLVNIAKAEYSDPLIKNDDILSVFIQTLDPTATQLINSINIPTTTTGSSGLASLSQASMPSIPGQQGAISGFLVDHEGNITIPVLGKYKAAGKTTTELRDSLTTLASKYYKDPTVIVRFANFKVTVTGEVAKPGQYIVPNERVSVLDAIAMAGDLTVFAKRENVLLLRENPDGTKTPYRINLKKSEILSSQYYYLRQNDIIYVEPGSGKAAATDASQARYYALGGSLLSVLIILFTRK